MARAGRLGEERGRPIYGDSVLRPHLCCEDMDFLEMADQDSDRGEDDAAAESRELEDEISAERELQK